MRVDNEVLFGLQLQHLMFLIVLLLRIYHETPAVTRIVSRQNLLQILLNISRMVQWSELPSHRWKVLGLIPGLDLSSFCVEFICSPCVGLPSGPGGPLKKRSVISERFIWLNKGNKMFKNSCE